MKIKRFVAPDMRQALRRVREEQGPDAVILSNSRVADGVEIIAALDYDEALVREALGSIRAGTDAAGAPARSVPQDAPAQNAGADTGSAEAAARASADTRTQTPTHRALAEHGAREHLVARVHERALGEVDLGLGLVEHPALEIAEQVDGVRRALVDAGRRRPGFVGDHVAARHVVEIVDARAGNVPPEPFAVRRLRPGVRLGKTGRGAQQGQGGNQS